MKYLFFFFTAFLAADVAYFQPPEGWQMVDPKELSPYVQILFMGKPENNFSPTVNLAMEKTEATFKEYFKDVKEYHRSNREETWRDLGKFPLQCGEGRLTEITSSSPAGEIKMLQAIFLKNKTAYIITTAVLKSEFAKYQSALLQAIRSLTIAPDLFSAVKQPEEKSKIETAYAALGENTIPEEQRWNEWQKLLENNSHQMGEHWRFLALQEGWSRIHSFEMQKSE